MENNLQQDNLNNADTPQGKHVKRKISAAFTIVLVVALVVFVGLLLLRWLWIGTVSVDGKSMMPNYANRDVVWVNKSIPPKRGDVVVVYVRTEKTFWGEFAMGDEVASGGKYEKWIKRVVALEGDSIWWEPIAEDDARCVLKIKTPDGTILSENDGDNTYYRHGKQAQFFTHHGSADKTTVPYLFQPASSNPLFDHDSEEKALVIPKGAMFLLGDNRYDSRDSRVEGFFPIVNVYGVVINP